MKPHLFNIRILPNVLTVAAVCLSLSAIKMILDNHPTESIAFLSVAAILDALDGRVARMLNATSKMGEEIDSLADAVNFGVAPAYMIYISILEHFQFGWITVLLYVTCIILRLARFNTLLDVDQLVYEREYFVGMPAPAGAIGAIGPLAAQMQFGEGWWTNNWLVCFWVITVSLLVVSRIPMYKIHTLSVSPKMFTPLLALVAIDVTALVSYSYMVIIFIIVAYIIHVPFAIRTKNWIANHPEFWNEKPHQLRAIRRANRRAQLSKKSMSRLGLRKPEN